MTFRNKLHEAMFVLVEFQGWGTSEKRMCRGNLPVASWEAPTRSF